MFYKDTLLKKVLKPGRYTGGEFGQTIKDLKDIKCRFAFAFPDTYEIGMSNLGVRILYDALNRQDDIYCERAYCPWVDMEEQMKKYGYPVCSHETGTPLADFDILGFTLQYELCYTNVLNMLSLSGIPLLSSERGEEYPVIIGGGPCSYNAEPLCDFFDVFSIGEGEDALVEFSRLYIKMKGEGTYTKAAFLRECSRIPGFYVPSLYKIEYNSDGTLCSCAPLYDDVPPRVEKRIIKNLDEAPFPETLVMPYIECVQDRITLEPGRGCIRGCRFCQAGMIYRPIREKSPEVLDLQARELYKATGYDEISMCCLSISDYSRLPELTDKLLTWTNDRKVSLSLPSLRADSFTKELMDKVSTVRTTSLTFAPEAGTQRLRDVINKNITEEEILRACRVAFEAGKNTVKLYFMIGLPTETDEDLAGIAALASKVVDEFYKTPGHAKCKPLVTVSAACFIPKPFTAFQWEAQNTAAEFDRKQQYIRSLITDRRIRFNYHDSDASFIEAVFARGDRRLSKALLLAARRGFHFDAWNEYFSLENWLSVFAECGIDPAFYANRERAQDELLPWCMISCGVSDAFLTHERKRAYEGTTTPSCKEKCAGCGANRLGDCIWNKKKI